MKFRYVTAALVALSLAGCSSQVSGDGGAKAQGVTATTIKIGTTLPLTGGAANSASGFKMGLEAAVAEANENGGIGGRKVELTILDDGFEAARSVTNIRRLGDEEKVFAVVSPAGSANLPGSWPYVKQTSLPVFGPVLPANPGIKPVYLLGSSHEDQARIIVDFLAKKGVKSVGVISQDNTLGKAILDGVKKQVQVQGIKVVATENTEPNNTDVSSATLNLRKANPDAVIFGTDNTQTGLIMKQADQLGWHPIFIGDSSTMNAGTTSAITPAGSAAKGAYGTLISDLPQSDAEPTVKWRKVMEKYAPNGANNAYALQAYASFQVFSKIVSSMGNPTWDGFSEGAEALHAYETGLLPPVTFGPPPGGRVGTVGARVAQWDGKEWKAITDWLKPTS